MDINTDIQTSNSFTNLPKISNSSATPENFSVSYTNLQLKVIVQKVQRSNIDSTLTLRKYSLFVF